MSIFMFILLVIGIILVTISLTKSKINVMPNNSPTSNNSPISNNLSSINKEISLLNHTPLIDRLPPLYPDQPSNIEFRHPFINNNPRQSLAIVSEGYYNIFSDPRPWIGNIDTTRSVSDIESSINLDWVSQW